MYIKKTCGGTSKGQGPVEANPQKNIRYFIYKNKQKTKNKPKTHKQKRRTVHDKTKLSWQIR